MIRVDSLKPGDYDDILVGWWKDWRWTPPSRDFLPLNGEGGFMIYDDDIKAKKEIDGQQVTVGPRLQLKQMLGVGMVYQF
jgi:hypothetical protein